MDKLEDFIRENRSRLDPYEPPVDSWKRISGRKPGGKNTRLIIYSAAATVIILAGLVFFLRIQQATNPKKPGTAATAQQELRETETFYNSLYRNIYNQARPLLTGQPDVMKEIDNNTSYIDSICADLKKDLKDNVSNREVIEALVRNYRIKIQLLEEMLEVVKQNETDKKADSHDL